MSDEFWNTNCILKVYRGSLAYGTAITKELSEQTGLAESDEDFLGICIPPLDYLFGLQNFEQKENKDPDEVIYSLRKYIHLALNCNPNIIEALFTPEDLIVHIHPLGQKLLDHRYLFLTKRVKHTFGGYAYAQQQKALKTTNTDEDIKKMLRHGRGQQRIELVQRYEYDTKAAMHLIRLLRMGIEILETGELYVRRPDAQELLDIRLGKFSREELIEMTEQLFIRLENAYQHSKLPYSPNFDTINRLCMDLHKEFYGIEL